MEIQLLLISICFYRCLILTFLSSAKSQPSICSPLTDLWLDIADILVLPEMESHLFSLFFIFERERKINVFTTLKIEIITNDSWEQRRKGYKCLHFIILKWTVRNESKGQSQDLTCRWLTSYRKWVTVRSSECHLPHLQYFCHKFILYIMPKLLPY